MATGMWTSVSGAVAQSQAVDTVANNLANADTAGFKKDLPAFKEYISKVERDYDRPALHIGPVMDKHLDPVLAKDQSHVVVKGTYTNYKQGPIKVTRAPLDIALEGPGMIEVSTPQGLRYTRNGSFAITAEGRLVTKEGFPVLMAQDTAGGNGALPEGVSEGSLSDPSVAGRFISLRDRPNVSFTDKGEVFSNGELIGKLSIVDFKERKWLMKAGNQMFVNTNPAANPKTDGTAETTIHQGMVEGSNVNPIEEMTNLIKANRMFEADLKVMKAYGELMGKEANEIGR